MQSFDDDLQNLEMAMSRFFKSMKRPQHWARVIQHAGIQLDRPAAQILHILSHQDTRHCRVQDLATMLGIEAPSVTRKTQELEQLGYLKRQTDPRDRRAVSLVITAKGRTVARRLGQAQRETITQVLSSWPDTKRHQFVQLFDRFSQDVEKYYEQPTSRQERKTHAINR